VVPVHVTRQQVRHNSGGLNSLWSWFKRKDASKKEAAPPVIKTKDLVKNIEQQSKAGWESTAATEQKTESKEEPKSFASETAVDLEVIGMPAEQLPLSSEKLAEIGLGKFQLKQAEIKPEAALEALKTVSAAVVGGMEGALDTLEKRLELVKQFQKESGIRIPDLIISTVATPQGVASYLEKSLTSNFNYWEPNAIYLDAKDFEGSNVTVVDAQQLRKQRQQAMDDLVSEAEQFVEQHDKETFKKALE
jgi:hypothetical protein